LPRNSRNKALSQQKGCLGLALPRWRIKTFILQLAVIAALAFFVHWVIDNTVANLARLQIVSGFGFLDMRAGISIPDSLIPYSEDSTYGRALLAGLVNTVFISVLCIGVATVLGTAIAFGRPSGNWLLRKLCLAYVEIFRNLPPLLVILFWYFGVLQQVLPPVRQSFAWPLHVYINQRGIYFPALHVQDGGFGVLFAAGLVIILALAVFSMWRRKKPLSGTMQVSRRANLAGMFVLLVLVCWLMIYYGRFDIPQLGTFNITGGASVSPEFLALFLGLSLYTAALISETIRAGITGVDAGLKEAGASLGLHPRTIARFITLPLALRIIIPPLASQYMNLVKNTSLAVAIGYSDLMRIGNTVLNQTNQSVEVVVIWMIAYLGLSLLVSVVMNWFNHKTALVEH